MTPHQRESLQRLVESNPNAALTNFERAAIRAALETIDRFYAMAERWGCPSDTDQYEWLEFNFAPERAELQRLRTIEAIIDKEGIEL